MATIIGGCEFRDGAIITYVRCEPCMYGSHQPNGEWHTWAGQEDIDHAKATGQDVPAILKVRCACDCVGVNGPNAPAEIDWPDEIEYESQNEPCTECGEPAACGYDFEGRPMFHGQAEDEDA
jgi:hypothetical protein